MALLADIVAGPPAVVAAPVLEADVVDGPRSLGERLRSSSFSSSFCSSFSSSSSSCYSSVFVVVDGSMVTYVVQPHRGVNTIPSTQRAQFMHE